MSLAAWAAVLVPFAALAQEDPVIPRALIERDRQSAEFSRPELRDYHLRRDQQHAPSRPDERQAEARERDALPVIEEKPVVAPDYRPLPLPGGPVHGVDPIPVQRRGS